MIEATREVSVRCLFRDRIYW